MTEQTIITLIIELAGGLVVLFFGRRLFWFFIGLTGFTLAFLVVSALFGLSGVLGWIALGIGLAVGVAGAIFAFVAQRMLIRVVGLLVGIVTGLVAFILLRGFFGVTGSAFFFVGWIIVGGLVGLALSRWAANLALIFFTALLGADAITAVLNRIVGLPGILTVPLFFVLLLLGIGVQGGLLRRRTTAPVPRAPRAHV